jgi:hypothetical protein
MIPEKSKKLFIDKYVDFGGDKFYNFLENYGENEIGKKKKVSPELELLGYYNKFLVLYRRDNNQVFLEIAKLFRRAAHKTYRVMLKRKIIDINHKFLNLVG